MATPSTTLQTSYGFFHSSGKTLMEETQYVGNSKYSSGHIIQANEILTETIDYCPTVIAANNFCINNPTILKKYNQIILTEVPSTNQQSYYINDNGQWMRPIILPATIPNPTTNEPSDGFNPSLYLYSGGTYVLTAPTTGVWWIDPFQGIIKFGSGYTPNISYPPKLTCYVYIGKKFTDFIQGEDTKQYVYNNIALSVPTSTSYTINHNLGSYDLETNIWAYDPNAISNGVGGWIQQLAPLINTNENQSVLLLTEAMDVRVTFRVID